MVLCSTLESLEFCMATGNGFLVLRAHFWPPSEIVPPSVDRILGLYCGHKWIME